VKGRNKKRQQGRIQSGALRLIDSHGTFKLYQRDWIKTKIAEKKRRAAKAKAKLKAKAKAKSGRKGRTKRARPSPSAQPSAQPQ